MASFRFGQRTKQFAWPYIKPYDGILDHWKQTIFWAGVGYYVYKKISPTPLAYPEFKSTNSIFSKQLSVDTWESNCFKKTKDGHAGLSTMLTVAVEHPDEVIGIRASDEGAFGTFAEVFTPIIKDVHQVQYLGQTHDTDVSKITGQLRAPAHSVRVSFSRNLKDTLMSPTIDITNRVYNEWQITKILALLTDEFAGEYISVDKYKGEDPQLAFEAPNKFDKSAKIDREWPANRGVHVNAAKNFAVQVNGQDHIKIISKENGSDIKGCFERATKGLAEFQGIIKQKYDREFSYAEGMGYLTVSLDNIGTSMKVSVSLDLPGYAKEGMAALKKRCHHLGVESSCAAGGLTFDISNKYTLGKTEVELAQLVLDSVNTLYEDDLTLQKKHGLMAVPL